MSEMTIAKSASQLGRADCMCMFSRGPDERDESSRPFLADRLSARHKCLAVVDTGDRSAYRLTMLPRRHPTERL
jgi:hypothetical protein